MFLQASVILSTIGLMATRSLLILVTARSVRILLECFLVPLFICGSGGGASLAPFSVQLFYFQAVFGKNYVSTPWGWHPLLLGKPVSATGVPFSIFILRSSLSVNLCIKIYFILFQEIDYFSLFYLDVYFTFLRNLN